MLHSHFDFIDYYLFTVKTTVSAACDQNKDASVQKRELPSKTMSNTGKYYIRQTGESFISVLEI